jgi:hypothetical protein
MNSQKPIVPAGQIGPNYVWLFGVCQGVTYRSYFDSCRKTYELMIQTGVPLREKASVRLSSQKSGFGQGSLR